MTTRTSERKTKNEKKQNKIQTKLIDPIFSKTYPNGFGCVAGAYIHSFSNIRFSSVRSFVAHSFLPGNRIFRHEKEEETAAAKRSLLSTAQSTNTHKHQHTHMQSPPTRHTPQTAKAKRKRIENGDGGSMVDVLCQYRP